MNKGKGMVCRKRASALRQNGMNFHQQQKRPVHAEVLRLKFKQATSCSQAAAVAQDDAHKLQGSQASLICS